MFKLFVLDLDYMCMMMGFLFFNDRFEVIGMIGFGGGLLVKFCYVYLLFMCIDVVEINFYVIVFRDMFYVLFDGIWFCVC